VILRFVIACSPRLPCRPKRPTVHEYKRAGLSKRETTSGFIEGGMEIVYLIEHDMIIVVPGDTHAIHRTMLSSKLHLKCKSQFMKPNATDCIRPFQ
jgi:hypothetical protein